MKVWKNLVVFCFSKGCMVTWPEGNEINSLERTCSGWQVIKRAFNLLLGLFLSFRQCTQPAYERKCWKALNKQMLKMYIFFLETLK